MNQTSRNFADMKMKPAMLAELLELLHKGAINQNTAKSVLVEMLDSGKSAPSIIQNKGLAQISDEGLITNLVADVIATHPEELASYLSGKETLSNWFFGQVMKSAGGKANPVVLKAELEKQLSNLKK